MTKKKKRFDSCTIKRTWVETHGTLNMNTGEHKAGKKKTVTGPCNTPLFGVSAKQKGICEGCARGWEVPDNKFLNETEKRKAMMRDE